MMARKDPLLPYDETFAPGDQVPSEQVVFPLPRVDDSDGEEAPGKGGREIGGCKHAAPGRTPPAYFLVIRIGSQFNLSARYDRRVAPSGRVSRPALK